MSTIKPTTGSVAWSCATDSYAGPNVSIEQEIRAKGLTAPCVTPADIEAIISSEHYFTARDGVGGAFIKTGVFCEPGNYTSLAMLTFCVLVMRNGHTVTGESHCADPAKFNAETGRVEARKRAIDQLWPMVVYAERERMHRNAEFIRRRPNPADGAPKPFGHNPVG